MEKLESKPDYCSYLIKCVECKLDYMLISNNKLKNIAHRTCSYHKKFLRDTPHKFDAFLEPRVRRLKSHLENCLVFKPEIFYPKKKLYSLEYPVI